MSYEDIVTRVRDIIAGVAGRDEGEVQPSARLARDLGFESIDRLDLTYRLEQAFYIRIPRGDLFPATVLRDDPKSDDFTVDYVCRYIERRLNSTS